MSPLQPVRIGLGFRVSLPPGWVAQVRGDNSAAFREVVCQVDAIDHYHQGELSCVLYTLRSGITVRNGDKVCRLSFARVESVRIVAFSAPAGEVS